MTFRRRKWLRTVLSERTLSEPERVAVGALYSFVDNAGAMIASVGEIARATHIDPDLFETAFGKARQAGLINGNRVVLTAA
jgi:DNA-binding IscR family transcriptional regulator